MSEGTDAASSGSAYEIGAVSATRRLLKRIHGARPGSLLFAAAVLTSGVVLLHYLHRLTFWRDEWEFLLHRRGAGLGVIFRPFVEQLLAIPVVVYKVLVRVFGMDSPFPFQLSFVTLLLLSVVLLFIYLRRRVGEWLALAVTLPLLFFGQSWDDVLFPFQMSFFGSMACGLGALLALDRNDRRGDWLATGLLCLSLLFSHLGIPFVAGITLEIALGRDRFRRGFVVAIPTVIWGLWYLRWGHTAQNFISFENFATLTGYVPDGFGSSLSSLLGLGAPRDDLGLGALEGKPLEWGRPLLLVAIGFGGWRLLRMPSIPRRLWTVLAIAVVFWALVGLNAFFFGQAADVGRYQFPGAVLVLLIAAELVRGMKVPKPALIAAVGIGVLAALSNFNTLRDAARGLATTAQQERGGLAALELSRGQVAPGFGLTPANSDVDYLGLLDARSYFSAVDAYGSPAYSPSELASSSEAARVAADKVSAAALGLQLSSPAAIRPKRCAIVKPSPVPAVISLRPGQVLLRTTGGTVNLRLRRFSNLDLAEALVLGIKASERYPVDLGQLSPGRSAALEIPRDLSSSVWRLQLSGPGAVRLCRVSGG